MVIKWGPRDLNSRCLDHESNPLTGSVYWLALYSVVSLEVEMEGLAITVKPKRLITAKLFLFSNVFNTNGK